MAPFRVESRCGDVDGDGYAVGEHVVHGGPAARLLDQPGERLGLGLALDVEDHPHRLETVADARVETEDAEQVDVPLDPGGHLPELDTPRRGDVGQAAHQTAPERLEQVLGRRGCMVLTHEDGGVVGVDDEPLRMGLLGSCAMEVVDGGPVVRSGDPTGGGPELESREFRLGAHRVQGGEQLVGVDAVALGCRTGGHDCFLSSCGWVVLTRHWPRRVRLGPGVRRVSGPQIRAPH
jgi:hypothetical protein